MSGQLIAAHKVQVLAGALSSPELQAVHRSSAVAAESTGFGRGLAHTGTQAIIISFVFTLSDEVPGQIVC